MDLKKYGVVSLILLYMVFSITFSIGKVGVTYGTSTLFIALRMLLGGFLMLTTYIFMNKERPKFAWHDAWLFFQAMFFGIYLTYVLEFWALQYLSVAKSAFIFVLAPFFTALFARLRGVEMFSPRKVLGLCIGMLGFIPLTCIDANEISARNGVFSLSLPEIATIFSVACYAYSWIIVKELVEKRNYSSWIVNGTAMLGGGFGALITSFFCDGWLDGVSPVTNWNSFLLYVFLITIVGIFCYVLYSNLLRAFSPH